MKGQIIMNEKKSVNWGGVILGVLLIIVSLLSFRNPQGSLYGIIIFFALIAILNGVFSILIRTQIKNLTGYKNTAFLVLGILEILVGIIFMFRLNVGVVALAYVFAFWFIMDSIRNLFFLDHARNFGQGHYWLTLIISIIGVVIGVALFVNPLVSALTISFIVGAYLMLFGILYIINSIDL